MQSVLSPKLQRFAALRPGEEAIKYSLFHHKNLAAGALTSTYRFFNVAKGQQDPDTSAAASEEDTNMDTGSLLTAPNRMLVTKMNVPITSVTTDTIPIGEADNGSTESLVDDIARLTLRGLFVFKLLNKEYLRLSPLGLLGAGMGVWAALASSTTNSTINLNKTTANNGAPNNAQGYKVMLPIEQQTTFEAAISFPKSTLTTNVAVRVGVVLSGVLYRPEQ